MTMKASSQPLRRGGRTEFGEQALRAEEEAPDARRSTTRTPRRVLPVVAAAVATPAAIPASQFASVPKSVLNAMVSVGAALRTFDRLKCVDCTMGDAAHA